MSQEGSGYRGTYELNERSGSVLEKENPANGHWEPLLGWAGDCSELSDADAAPQHGQRSRTMPGSSAERLSFTLHPSACAQEPFAESVLAGLSAPQKSLACSWFYDERGSELFEQICDEPEYYLTRTERSILIGHAESIACRFPSPVTLVELGSGSSVKTRMLIDAFHQRQPSLNYCPIDISSEILHRSSAALLEHFPRLSVRALAADYLPGLQAIQQETSSPRLILFLGSTIGNFEPAAAQQFLAQIRQVMGPQDSLLLGFDLKKSREVIEAAYNDAAGVTARFNKNLLVRINRDLGGHFDMDAFEHRAPYIESQGRVEMRLVSRERQDIAIDALARSFQFQEGEYIHTESCHKYSEVEMAHLTRAAGLTIQQSWHDTRRWFALSLLTARC